MSGSFQLNCFMILSWMLYIPLPIVFFVILWRHKGTQFWQWLLQTALYGSSVLALLLIGVWPLIWGYWAREILVIGFIVVAIKSFFNVKRVYRIRYQGLKPLFSQLMNLAIFAILIWQSAVALQGSVTPSNPISLQFPLKQGNFCVVQGGDKEIINHHYSIRAQKFAVDLVQLGLWGLSTHKPMSKKLSDYVIYEAPLYSPCTGIVLEIIDQYQDSIPFVMNDQHPAGNYLVISVDGSDVVILMAHLQKGSFQVKTGDFVEAGQLIARVGNSGNTSEPHLHIQAVRKDTGDFLFTGEGVPMVFDGHFLVRNTFATVSEQEDINFLDF
jgi:hypothetical protein